MTREMYFDPGGTECDPGDVIFPYNFQYLFFVFFKTLKKNVYRIIDRAKALKNKVLSSIQNPVT